MYQQTCLFNNFMTRSPTAQPAQTSTHAQPLLRLHWPSDFLLLPSCTSCSRWRLGDNIPFPPSANRVWDPETIWWNWRGTNLWNLMRCIPRSWGLMQLPTQSPSYLKMMVRWSISDWKKENISPVLKRCHAFKPRWNFSFMYLLPSFHSLL